MIIIPARLKSTRFPNKVLAQIHGIPMIVRTAELAKE
ncbi:cytidylyltransferase domain-containing protein, partial [Helicobacter rodentium]